MVWLATTYGTRRAFQQEPEWTKSEASSDADCRADEEADHRLGPRVERLVHQEFAERRRAAALERLGEGTHDVPQVRQLPVRELQDVHRRIVEVAN